MEFGLCLVESEQRAGGGMSIHKLSFMVIRSFCKEHLSCIFGDSSSALLE